MLKYYLSFPIESSCRLWSPNHDHHTSTDVKCPLRASLSSTILPPPREITCQDIGRDIATLCDPTNLFSWLLDKGATVVKSAEFHESFASKKNKAKSSAFTTCFKLIHLVSFYYKCPYIWQRWHSVRMSYFCQKSNFFCAEQKLKSPNEFALKTGIE